MLVAYQVTFQKLKSTCYAGTIFFHLGDYI